MLSTNALLDKIDDCLKDSDSETDYTESIPKYGDMTLQELRDSFDLEELLENNLVIDIPDPDPKIIDSFLQTPTNTEDPDSKPPLTGANATPVTLKLKVPRPPARPMDPRNPPTFSDIAELEVRLVCQQPVGSRPDSVYLGSFRHPYATAAIRGCHLYNSILQDARTFLTNLSPFDKINQHMRLEIKQPKFTYLCDKGTPVNVSGKSIPRPISNGLPEPLYLNCPIAVLTLYVMIDVSPRAPRKATRKRSSPDSGHEEQQRQQGHRPQRSALPPPKHKKYLYEL